MPHTIYVALPSDRTRLGKLVVLDPVTGLTAFGPISCCGKASENTAPPGRDPRQNFGDTPTGEYQVTGKMPAATGGIDLIRFGPQERLKLTGILGDALIRQNAIDGSHETDLRIHGGRQVQYPTNAPAAPAGVQGLMVTNGCLRVFDHDMQQLLAYLDAEHVAYPFRMVVVEDDAAVQIGAILEWP